MATSFAQKIGYVDTEYIFNQIPEYKAAEAEINKNTADWQKEIEAKYVEINKLYEIYQAEKILLTYDLCKKREKAIEDKKKDVKVLQQQRFGTDGDIFKKRMELIKPIQDRVYNAIKSMAEKSKLAIVFDKANDMLLLHANSKYDKSDDVLVFLGVSKTKFGNGSNSHKKNK
ncbi:MAG TPA: OmpH family outer membrane protein [Bacteroidia bacterium]|nr:OmpH family outer membrane protein [Bacteroidia bacterium]